VNVSRASPDLIWPLELGDEYVKFVWRDDGARLRDRRWFLTEPRQGRNNNIRKCRSAHREFALEPRNEDIEPSPEICTARVADRRLIHICPGVA
jgi:hypothetical protein